MLFFQVKGLLVRVQRTYSSYWPRRQTSFLREIVATVTNTWLIVLAAFASDGAESDHVRPGLFFNMPQAVSTKIRASDENPENTVWRDRGADLRKMPADYTNSHVNTLI